MKTLLRAFPLWLILGALSWMLGAANDGDMWRPLTGLALVSLPAIAVWLTFSAVAVLPNHSLARSGFWILTVGGWLTLLVFAQWRGASDHYERSHLLSAVGVALLVAVWLGVKGRSWPKWRTLGEVSAAAAFLALLTSLSLTIYNAKTRSIFSKAEAKWTEIGLPLSDVDVSSTPVAENAGSAVLRGMLRESVGSHFYKDGTRAAALEPAVPHLKTTEALFLSISDLLSTKLPPADDLGIEQQPVVNLQPVVKRRGETAEVHRPPNFADLQPLSSTLDVEYRQILAVEPPSWTTDVRDGYSLNVPNFLGLRKLAQLIAVDATRRLSEGDEEGATRALAAGFHVARGVRQNPTLVSLMIDVAVESLLSYRQAWLPASEDGLQSVAKDTKEIRAEFLKRLQIEGWNCLRLADRMANEYSAEHSHWITRNWAAQTVIRSMAMRECANAVLNGAEHAAIEKSPSTLALPDYGISLHEAIARANPTSFEFSVARAAMRIHASLLLREQVELIRDARARLAAGRPVESRDSVVVPGIRWELIADVEKNTVATRMIGAPEWIVNHEIAPAEFWALPLDGSVSWKFHLPARSAAR